jgi:hypothetical protein
MLFLGQVWLALVMEVMGKLIKVAEAEEVEHMLVLARHAARGQETAVQG